MRPATVTQCAILAGGLGTRLGSLTGATPKAWRQGTSVRDPAAPTRDQAA